MGGNEYRFPTDVAFPDEAAMAAKIDPTDATFGTPVPPKAIQMRNPDTGYWENLVPRTATPSRGEDILGIPREMPPEPGLPQALGGPPAAPGRGMTGGIAPPSVPGGGGATISGNPGGTPIKFRPTYTRAETKSLIDSIPTVLTSDGSLDIGRWEGNIRNFIKQFPGLDAQIKNTLGDKGLNSYLREMREIMYENFGGALDIEGDVGAKSVEGLKKYGKAYVPGRLPQRQMEEVQRILQEGLTGQKTNETIVSELEDVYRRSLTGDYDILRTGTTMAEREKQYPLMSQRLAANELTETNPIVLAERRMAEARQLANREKFLTTMADATGEPIRRGKAGTWIDARGHEINPGFIVENHDKTMAWKMKTKGEALRVRELYETGGIHPADKGLMKFFGKIASPLLTMMTVGRVGFTVTNTIGNIDFIIRNAATSPADAVNAVRIYNQLRKFGGDAARFGDELMTVAGEKVRIQDFLAEALDTGAVTPPQIFLEAVTDPSHQNILYRTPLVKKFLAANQAVNNVSENGSRLAVYLSAKNTGSSAVTARNYVDKIMLDYELSDLMPVEQEIRKFVPFYTWSRRNIPASAQLAVERPGVFGAEMRLPRVLQANMNAPECSNRSYWDTYKQMGEFQRQQGMTFTMNLPGLGESAMNLRVPLADPLGMAMGAMDAVRGNPQGALSDVVGGLLGPTIKTGAELLTGSRMGTGQPLSRYSDAGTSFGDIGQFLMQSTPVVGPIFNAMKNTPGVNAKIPGLGTIVGKCTARGGDPQALTRALLSNIGLYNKAWNPEANQRNWNYADAASMEAQLRRATAEGVKVPTTAQAERQVNAVSTVPGPTPDITGEVQADGYTKWYRGDEYLGETSPGGQTPKSTQMKLMGVREPEADTSKAPLTFSDVPAKGVYQTDGSIKWYIGERLLGTSYPGQPMEKSLMAKIAGVY